MRETKELTNQLKEDYEDIKTAWANGAFADSKEHTDVALGMCRALEQVVAYIEEIE